MALGALSVSSLAQPPEPPRPPKPAAPPITLEELSAAIGGTTQITMHLKDVTYREILADLSRQSGIVVKARNQDEAARLKKYSIDIENQNFWQAIRSIGEVLKLYPQPWGANRELTMAPGYAAYWRGATQFSAPLMSLMVRQIERTHYVNFASPENADPAQAAPNAPRVELNSLVVVDPKLRSLGTTARYTVTEAVDEKGVSLMTETAEGRMYREIPLLWQGQFQLKYRPNMGRKLSRLRGSLRFFVVARSELWENNDVNIAKGATKTVKVGRREETYTVDSIEKEGNGYRVKIAVSRKTEAAPVPEEATPEAQQLRQARRELVQWMRLTDEAGNAYQGRYADSSDDVQEFVFSSNRQSPDDVKIGPAKKLSIDIPVEIRELTVPIEFKYLVLP